MKERQSIFSRIAQSCFYLGVVIEVLLVLIDKSAYTNPVEGRIFQITFLLFLVKVCLTRYTGREYAAVFLACIVGAISYFVTGRNEVIRLVMFIAACKDVDMKRCLKLVFYMTLTGCMVIILLSVTGIYGAVSLTQEYRLDGVETRYTLGMGHPNALQCMVWALTTLGLYLYGEKMKWYHYLLTMLVNIFFFLLTDSKTGLLVTVFTVVIVYMTTEKKHKIVSKLGAAIGIATTAFSVGISVVIAGNAYRVYNYVWNNDRTPFTLFLVKLNSLLTGRIRILTENDGFEGTIGTWRLFSRPENNYYFDLGWVRLFYWYGIIPGCIFVAVIIILMIYCYKKKQYPVLALIASFALYSVMEAHAVSVYLARNYVIFIIGQYWVKLISKEKAQEFYLWEILKKQSEDLK